jgi:hypothetical protein
LSINGSYSARALLIVVHHQVRFSHACTLGCLWVPRHPRFVPHFVPTSSSWLNWVERWFGELTAKAVRRGSFASVADLQSAIAAFLEAWNANPKPFVWTATIESIQAKLARCRQTLEQIKPGCTAPRTRKKKAKSPVISRTAH